MWTTEVQDFVLTKNLKISVGKIEKEYLIQIDALVSDGAKFQKITFLSIKEKDSNLPFQIISDYELFYPEIEAFVLSEIHNDAKFSEFAQDAVNSAKEE